MNCVGGHHNSFLIKRKDNGKQKIVKGQIIVLTPELSYTGAPESVLNMVDILIKMGYFVTVVSFSKGEKEVEFYGRGVEVVYLEKEELKTSSFAIWIKNYRLCIANTSMLAAQAVIIQKYIPTLLIIREAKSIMEFQQIFQTRIEDIKKVKEVYCVSKYAQREIEHQIGVKSQILYNYVPDRYSKRKERKGARVKFAIIGTIEERKGVDVCIKAFIRLKNQIDNCELHIVGRTLEWQRSYWEPLMTKIKEKDAIFYHGEIQNRDKLIQFYEEVDVVIVASRDESCSLVALEAAMMGKVLIVSQNVGAQYLVKFINGFIFQTGNVEHLVVGMKKYVKTYWLNKIRGKVSRYLYKKHASQKYYFKQLKKVIEGYIE